MAAPKFEIKLTATSIALGVGFVVIGLALFSWLLPMFVPAELIHTIAGVAIGILFWFLFLLSRQGAK